MPRNDDGKDTAAPAGRDCPGIAEVSLPHHPATVLCANYAGLTAIGFTGMHRNGGQASYRRSVSPVPQSKKCSFLQSSRSPISSPGLTGQLASARDIKVQSSPSILPWT